MICRHMSRCLVLSVLMGLYANPLHMYPNQCLPYIPHERHTNQDNPQLLVLLLNPPQHHNLRVLPLDRNRNRSRGCDCDRVP